MNSWLRFKSFEEKKDFECKGKKSVLLKTPSDDKTLHAFEHLSLLDLDDEDWDTMKNEYKSATDQCDDELEA